MQELAGTLAVIGDRLVMLSGVITSPTTVAISPDGAVVRIFRGECLFQELY
jgi:hypothetical protein